MLKQKVSSMYNRFPYQLQQMNKLDTTYDIVLKNNYLEERNNGIN